MDKIKYLKSKALDLLSRREYSYRELRHKLLTYAPEDDDTICMVLDDLVSRKFLDESRYIESFIHSKSRKYGELKIKFLLSQKSDNRELIQEIYSNQQIDELAHARQIRERRFGEMIPSDLKERNRQFRFLLNRGFAPEIILHLLKEKSSDE